MKLTIETRAKDIPDSLVEKVSEYLGVRGIRYFSLLNHFHGNVSPVLKLHESRKHIPTHSVHFNEGMQVRNFMRRQPECADWTCHDLDDNWAKVVELVVRNRKLLVVGSPEEE